MQRIVHRNHGFSLVEMLIVIALIAALAGLAIPAISRAGGFMSDDPDIAARELYASMRAARIYATTYRVDTAVVYGVTDPAETIDSVTGDPVRVIDSYGIARKLTREEREAFNKLGFSTTDSDYTMVRSFEARFRKLPANSCVISINNNYELTLGALGVAGSFAEGLLPIRLVDVNDTVAPPVPTIVSPLAGTNFGADAFPAHVFTPFGSIEAEPSTKARLTVNVALMPTASAEDRFAVNPGDTEAVYDEDSEEWIHVERPAGVLKVPVRIELFRTTGRVKMTS